MALSKAKRSVLRDMFGGNCAYCGHTLGDRWHADHVEPIVRKSVVIYENGRPVIKNGRWKVKTVGMWNPENDRDDNYFPACIPCNIHKGASTVEDWRRCLQGLTQAAMRDFTTIRHAHRFGLIQFTDAPIVFYFEKFMSKTSSEVPCK